MQREQLESVSHVSSHAFLSCTIANSNVSSTRTHSHVNVIKKKIVGRMKKIKHTTLRLRISSASYLLILFDMKK